VTPERTRALGLAVLAGLALGWWAQRRWPDAHPRLDCAATAVRWTGRGATAHARCGEGSVPPPAVLSALGLPLPLNRAAEEDLARLPGVGPRVAHALVEARPFGSWDEVDAVPGVGPTRLQTLRDRTALDP
jgi:competence protein ComEA